MTQRNSYRPCPTLHAIVSRYHSSSLIHASCSFLSWYTRKRLWCAFRLRLPVSGVQMVDPTPKSTRTPFICLLPRIRLPSVFPSIPRRRTLEAFPPLHSAPLLSLPLMLVPPAPRTSRLANTFSSSPSTPTAIRNPRCQADPSGWRCPGHSIRSPHSIRTPRSPYQCPDPPHPPLLPSKRSPPGSFPYG